MNTLLFEWLYTTQFISVNAYFVIKFWKWLSWKLNKLNFRMVNLNANIANVNKKSYIRTDYNITINQL